MANIAPADRADLFVPAIATPGNQAAAFFTNSNQRAPRLTDQECQVLSGVARGYSNRGISESLHVSRKTVEAHLSSVFLKLDIEPHPSRNQRVCAVLYWTTGLRAVDGPTGAHRLA